MGAIVGVFTRPHENARGLAEKMLHTLLHRGAQTRIALSKSIGYEMAIGCCAHYDVNACFSESSQMALALDGSFFRKTRATQASSIKRQLSSKSTAKTAVLAMMKEPGVFSALYYRKGHLYAFRDSIGFKPLFFGFNVRFVAFASERKALWQIGLTNVHRVRPGHLYVASSRGISTSDLTHLPRPHRHAMTLQESSLELKHLLTKSIQCVTRDQDRLAVAFSGGLDSSLTATLAKQINPNVELIAVGLSGSTELSTAENYASQLALPVTAEPFSPDCLEQYVRRVIWLIEEPDLMKVSIAIPLHWAAMVAARQDSE